jgi:hypothetical protein
VLTPCVVPVFHAKGQVSILNKDAIAGLQGSGGLLARQLNEQGVFIPVRI